jgi:eukaryotic-like serine/threonine-protein kinase
MTQRRKLCDEHRLGLLISNRLPQEAQTALESHLNGCELCRARLDQMARHDWILTEVRRQLGGDGASAMSGPNDTNGPASSNSVDLSFLVPSENPESLGRVGAYEVLEVVGRGGMGIVLKAFDQTLHRPVAIKVLAAEYWANGAARKRFAREAQAVAAVIHDHVVPIHAVDSEATPPYLVMAFIPGQSLQQRIDRHGPLELKEILRIGMQTAAGLAAAHAQGLVHRDIKPSNIMLENGIERVRITDFGLARSVDDATLTRSGAVAGTPAYMAPEQADRETVDQRADLFALGSVLYAMATGHPPFRGTSLVAIIRQVCDQQPKPIALLNPAVPAWCQGIIQKLHNKDPEQRFQSAGEVADLLERCLAHLQHPDRHPLPPLAKKLGRQVSVARSFASRGARRWAGLAVLTCLGLTAMSLLVLLQKPESEMSPDFGAHKASAERAQQTENAIGDLDALRIDAGDLRARVNAFQQKLAGNEAPGGPSPDFKQLSRAADRLRASLFVDSETSADPVAASIDSMKQRVRQLQQQLAFRPE